MTEGACLVYNITVFLMKKMWNRGVENVSGLFLRMGSMLAEDPICGLA